MMMKAYDRDKRAKGSARRKQQARRRRFTALTALTLLTVSALVAQDSWHTHRGSQARLGVTTNSRNSNVNLLLSWTYPALDLLASPIDIDNSTAQFSSSGSWDVPAANSLYYDFYRDPNDTNNALPPYLYTSGDRDVSAVAEWRSHVSGSSDTNKAGFYRIFVWIASPPVGAPINTSTAVYTVFDSNSRSTTVRLDQRGTGSWVSLGNTSFYYNGTTPIRVRLTNEIPVDSPDYNEDVSVIADAMRFEPDYGVIQASPVAIQSPIRSNDHLVYTANGNGNVFCFEHPTSTRSMRVRWSYKVPNVPESEAGVIYDDPSVDGVFWELNTGTDQYGSDYVQANTTNNASQIKKAVWRVRVPEDGDYFVYAWFPSGTNHARKAIYEFENEDQELGGFERVYIDQRNGGQWVQLGARAYPFLRNINYDVSVSNFVENPATDPLVVADAVKLVRTTGVENSVFSTPHIGTARVKGAGSKLVAVFGSDNGRVYCVDALGDGQNGTLQGETKSYWIMSPSFAGPFLYNSPLLVNNVNARYPNPNTSQCGGAEYLTKNTDLVIIGNANGRVYALDTQYDMAQSALDDCNNPGVMWQYQAGSQMVAAPVYDGSGKIFVGSLISSFYGRLTALDVATGERIWEYPNDLDPDSQIGAVTATPALFNGKVYVATTIRNQGQVVCLNASTGELIWKYPAKPDVELSAIQYSSPTVIQGIDYYGNAQPINVLYVGAQDGRVYYFNADTGERLLDTNGDPESSGALGGALFSSNAYSGVRDLDADGNSFGNRQALTIGTNGGDLYAIHATSLGGANGKAFEKWNLLGDSIFTSPAVLDSWLYVADDAGVLYAFNANGLTANQIAQQYPQLADEITQDSEPDQDDVPDEFRKLRVTITTDKEYADSIRNGTISPDQSYTTKNERDTLDALEWGQTFYVILWNFKRGTGSNASRPINVLITGPGNLREQRPANTQTTTNPPQEDPDLDVIAVLSFTVQANGQNFWSPGRGYEMQIEIPGASWSQDMDRVDTGVQRFDFGIANPLGVSGVGSVGTGAAITNLVNGNGNQSVMIPWVYPANFTHAMQANGQFRVADRRGQTTGFSGQSAILQVRVRADDAHRDPRTPAIESLPWEDVGPAGVTRFPNTSVDYPDISARRLQLLFEGGSDMQRTTVRPRVTTTSPADGSVVQSILNVPRYQPPGNYGYLSRVDVFVDSNNNGRFDGANTIVGSLVNQQRQEAYRELAMGNVFVNAAPEMIVEEQTVVFGSLPAGFGFNTFSGNPTNLSANNPLSLFLPKNPANGADWAFTPFWKKFTVKNEGNVNLINLRVRKGGAMYSDTVTNLNGLPLTFTLVSNLDNHVFTNQTQVPVYDPRQGSQVWLQKPRPGDPSPTYLSLPAIPYGQPRNPALPKPEDPKVALAIPPFQPLGTYAQEIVVDNDRPAARTRSNPTMRGVVRVRETRMTGGTNVGTQPIIDPNPPAQAPNFTNTGPAAFRSRSGHMHIYWSSNRAGNPNNFYLYKSSLRWNDQSLPTSGWNPAAVSGNWWNQVVGPFPNDPDGVDFERLLSLQSPLTDTEKATIRHTSPGVYRSADGQPWLFWVGSVQVANVPRSAMFYTRINDETGMPEGERFAVPIDLIVPKGRPSLTGYSGLINWLFYTASTSGRESVNYIPVGANMTNWGREQRLPISRAIRTVNEISAIARRVRVADAFNNNNGRDRLFIETVITGTTGDRNLAEVFLARYGYTRRGDGRLGDAELFPIIVDEVATKETTGNVWRTRHLDWNYQSRTWNDLATNLDLEIKVNGFSIISDPGDPRYPQTPTVDEATGLLTFRYRQPVVENGTITRYREVGNVVVDPLNGLVRFPQLAPKLSDMLTVTYRPRLLRITPLNPAGSHSQVTAFLQQSENPRHGFTTPAESWVRKSSGNTALTNTEIPPTDRLWTFYRRSGNAPASPSVFYYKTYRMGVQLPTEILRANDGSFPLSQSTSVQAGVNHATVIGNNLGYYEYDPVRGRVYFTATDEGKPVRIIFLRADTGQQAVFDTTIRWIEESVAPNRRDSETQLPLDLPTNEMYLWAMPNEISYRRVLPQTLLAEHDGSVFLFWNSTRNGAPDIYSAAIQPRFYIDERDRDGD
ncbi:MAG: PQQ-binding-like beta-propeller repeat protein [Fimbriimonadia bacterium]|nr:PQQ-binding-like beta-propeller repeat protein [Fimbriimonadia bacterium]